MQQISAALDLKSGIKPPKPPEPKLLNNNYFAEENKNIDNYNDNSPNQQNL